MRHVVVVSDTHIRRGASRRLPDAAYAHARHPRLEDGVVSDPAIHEV